MTATTDLLIADHDKVEALNRQFTQAESPRARQQIFDEVRLELLKHTTAEEEVVYPAVRQHVPDGNSMIDHAIDEHNESKDKIAELERLTSNDPTFAAKFAQMIDGVMHHAAEEENNMFHMIDRHFPADSHEEIVSAIEASKRKVIA